MRTILEKKTRKTLENNRTSIQPTGLENETLKIKNK